MNERNRVFGNNVKFLIVNGKFNEQTVADLYLPRPEDEYHEVGCMACRGAFSSSENKTCILDLLDMYCDVQELIAMS